MAGGSPSGASLVARTVAVLRAFDPGHRRLSLTDIAARAGLPAPTTLRIVRQLVDAQALSRRDDGTYVIGRFLWDVGLLAPVNTGLREVAAPYLQDLHAATRATVHLATRDGDAALYLDRLVGHASVPVVSRVGGRLPLHATGVGKVLLAHAPDDVRTHVLTHLSRHTAYTVMSPGTLERQLADIRRVGFATTTEEMTLGACSVGVPIRVRGRRLGEGSDAEVIAAIGIVVGSLRRDKSRLVSALHVAAQGISRELVTRGLTAGDG